MKKFLWTVGLISNIANAAEIKMKSLTYDPPRLEIKQGESVTWKNTAYTEHSATSENNPLVFDTGMIQPGKESKPVRFDKPGVYKFHCALHGSTMTGTIIVKELKK